jgi:hypothetical protein
MNDERIAVIEAKQLMLSAPVYRFDSPALDASGLGWREFALQGRVNRARGRNRLVQRGARQLSHRFLNLGELGHSWRFSRGNLQAQPEI